MNENDYSIDEVESTLYHFVAEGRLDLAGLSEDGKPLFIQRENTMNEYQMMREEMAIECRNIACFMESLEWVDLEEDEREMFREDADRFLNLKVGNLRIGVVDEGADMEYDLTFFPAWNLASEGGRRNLEKDLKQAGWRKVITQENEGE